MKIIDIQKTKNKATIKAEVTSQEYAKAYDKVLAEASRTMNIPGFRAGKVPKNILEQNISQSAAKERSLDFVVENNYAQIITEAGIDPVDYPSWKFESQDDEKTVFTLEVEIMPELVLPKYKGITGEKKVRKIEDKDIESYIKALTEESAQINEITDRAVKLSDIADLNVTGSIKGEVKEPLSQRALPILLGDNRIAPGFDDNIVGMNIGEEKTFVISLPKDYFIKEYAGEDAQFSVKLNRIAERKLPEFDDAYVSKISSFKTVDEYRQNLRTKFEEAALKEAEAELKDKLLEKVSADTEIELPSSVIRREGDIMLDELKDSMLQRGLTIERYLASRKMTLEDLKKEILPGATTRAKAKMVLREIVKKESLELTDDEFNSEIADIAKESGRSESEYKASEGMKEYIRDYLLRRKALDFIVENAKIK